MKRTALGTAGLVTVLTVLILSLAGCAKPVGRATPAAPDETPCAQKFAAAMTSPGQPVRGVFACQAPSLVFVEMKAGLGTDADLASYASKSPVFHHAALSGRMADGGILYLLTGDGVLGRLLVWVDASGKVKDFIIAKCTVSCAAAASVSAK